MKGLYEIVTALNVETLEERVTSRGIGLGFEPIGGVTVVWHPEEKCLYFYQAMIGKQE